MHSNGPLPQVLCHGICSNSFHYLCFILNTIYLILFYACDLYRYTIEEQTFFAVGKFDGKSIVGTKRFEER